MQRKIFAAITLGFLMSFSVVLAQETNVKILRQNLKTQLQTQRETLKQESQSLLQNIKSKSATPEQKQNIQKELQNKREDLRKGAEELRQNVKEKAQELRTGFREKIKDVKERARIAAAHGKGLRMLNRFRSAAARFDHILGRLESRTQKLQEKGIDVSSVTPLIEEAKNMSVQNRAKLEELKAKYESLLEGENPQGIGEEARQIAQELKTETENLHAKLKEIVLAIKALSQ
ncbi:MAG: hypothetical protein HYW70_03570 [Candidatus Nealsonbacteria bacterium]|nr:hypothetical protein [Candidatus Nealsonbacteria bacterium]